jgi:hypothetical protein
MALLFVCNPFYFFVASWGKYNINLKTNAMMKDKDLIEIELNEAKSLHFAMSRNYEKEPSVLVLIFNKKHEGSAAYNWLLNNRERIDKKLSIKKENKTRILTIRHAISGEVINIKNLAYDIEELNTFVKNEPQNGAFVFAIGFYDELNRLNMTQTEEDFQPLAFKQYEII